MGWTNPSITGTPTISPSDTIRWKSFGAASSGNPNPIRTPAQSNTEIISINNDVISQLTTGDVRSNYVMNGATWTVNGFAPTNFFQILGSPSNGAIVGTSVLSNSTIETTTQGVNTVLQPSMQDKTCFTCHISSTGTVVGGSNVKGYNVSHDFGALLPMTSFTSNPGYTLSGSPGNVFADVSFGQFVFVPIQLGVSPFGGFQGNVSFTVAGLPQGVNAIFDRVSTSNVANMILAVSPQTLSGVSNVEVTGTSGNLKSTTMISLTVKRK